MQEETTTISVGREELQTTLTLCWIHSCALKRVRCSRRSYPIGYVHLVKNNDTAGAMASTKRRDGQIWLSMMPVEILDNADNTKHVEARLSYLLLFSTHIFSKLPPLQTLRSLRSSLSLSQ